jgi:hypothetical protein
MIVLKHTFPLWAIISEGANGCKRDPILLTKL